MTNVQFGVTYWLVFVPSLLLLILAAHAAESNVGRENEVVELSHMSEFSRSLASQSAVASSPETPRVSRKTFPQNKPHICLAFLSCCNRIDLLNHTLAGAIRHMEEDEPPHLRYEIAWVDNGSDSKMTEEILSSYQLEHALPMSQNFGLAYGMNLLIENLCTAPFILLLEEDWLYLDDVVVEQTDRRKAVITTAIAFVEQNPTAYDGRKVLGAFLRPESYSSFLTFPYLDIWQDMQVDIHQLGPPCDQDEECDGRKQTENIKYQIVCSDPSLSSKYSWGSFTNGAGLYKREALKDIGRMYGEPGDAFYERYVEANYAYRVGLKYCHAAIQLGDCRDIGKRECAAAFHHIGGGRGTRPRLPDSKCASELWTFVGTPMFHRYRTLLGGVEMCSKEDIQKLKTLKNRAMDSEEYRQEVKEQGKVLFEKERAHRQKIIEQAQILKAADKDWVRENVDGMSGLTDDEIDKTATSIERLARSPHPLEGYWDSHGRPLI